MQDEDPQPDLISRLTAERDHYQKIAEEGLDIVLDKMRYEKDQGFDAEFTGEAVKFVALAFVGHFKSLGATNFVEMTVVDEENPIQRYSVTIRKEGAKSPADLLREAKERITELEAALSAKDRALDKSKEREPADV